jgi:hypothetical protein
MLLRVTRADYLDGYRFSLEFSDGHAGIIDLEERLYGPVFSRLKNRALFARGKLDPESGALAWPGDIHLAPDYLQVRTLPSTFKQQQ